MLASVRALIICSHARSRSWAPPPRCKGSARPDAQRGANESLITSRRLHASACTIDDPVAVVGAPEVHEQAQDNARGGISLYTTGGRRKYLTRLESRRFLWILRRLAPEARVYSTSCSSRPESILASSLCISRKRRAVTGGWSRCRSRLRDRISRHRKAALRRSRTSLRPHYSSHRGSLR
jgi:hypothetical protein